MKLRLAVIKRVLGVCLSIAFIILFPNLLFRFCTNSESDSDIDKTLSDKKEIKMNLDSALCAKYGIIEEWERILLNGNPTRNVAVKSIEINKVWRDGNLILFKGYLHDVRDINQVQCELEFGLGWKYRLRFPKDIFRLRVIIDKDLYQKLLFERPNIINDASNQFTYDSYLVASVDSIAKIEISDSNGGTDNLWVGYGQWEEIIFFNDSIFLHRN